jgi:KRAB domain-containing zinc finger protein
MKKIKIEPFCDDSNQVESVASIENNIKKEPEVQFVLMLPPRQVKIEKFIEENETENDDKKFQCQQCPKSFEKQKNLYNHEQIHKPRVKCQICCKTFKKLSLKDHLKRHEGINKFYCDHCSVGFVTKGDLFQHMWKHRKDKWFSCTQCSRGFNNKENFKAHFFSHSTNPRPFQCDLCSKSYSRKGHIKKHLTAIHTEKIFKCDECDYTTKRKVILNQHKKRQHSKAFSCSVCAKKFKNKKCLQRHQSVHKATKDFDCKTCGKMFRSQNSLKQHERSVHGKIFSLLASNMIMIFLFSI